MGGSKKQLKVSWNKLYFGEYSSRFISLSPFPIAQMHVQLKKLPAPHAQQEFLRVGVHFKCIQKKWYQIFSEQALKEFYLYDVLIHEIGHHVDRANPSKSYQQKELFAEWFAGQYGFKKRKNR